MNYRARLIKNKKMRSSRVRSKVSGSSVIPRLSVFRSNKYTRAQLIDDEKGFTLASVSSSDFAKDGKIKNEGKIKRAEEVGRVIAEKALKIGVKTVVFDRRHYKYHGRVKAVALGAREAGLKI